MSFNSNEGSSVADQKVWKNTTITKPADPTKTGFVFDTWYKDSGLTQAFDFTSPIKKSTTLYAKWTESIKDIADQIIVVDGKFTYNGSMQTPTVKVIDKTLGTELKAGNDYTITYKQDDKEVASPTNAGDYTVVITAANGSKYTGSEDTHTFTISPASLKTAVVALDDKTLTYTGFEQEKTVTGVTLNGTALAQSDYIVANNKHTNASDAYTLMVVGTGNYTDFATVEWTIEKATLTIAGGAISAIKVDDGTSTASLTISPYKISGYQGIDSENTITVSGTGKYYKDDVETTAVGTNLTVKDFEFQIEGANAANYAVVSNDKSISNGEIKAKTYTVKFHGNGGKTSAGATEYTQTITIGSGAQFDGNKFSNASGDNTYGMMYWTTNENGSGTKYCDKFSTNSNDINPKVADQTSGVTGADLATKNGETIDLYAHWTENPLGAYWFATGIDISPMDNKNSCSSNKFYNNPESGVTKTQSEIDSDLANLQSTDDSIKNAAQAEYTSIMQADNMHMYTPYNSGTSTTENNYAEFRIVQVGAHANSADAADTDGSSLTFHAVRSLPAGYKMSGSYATNSGGWQSCALRPLMQSEGEIYKNFSSAFTSKIKSTVKAYNTGSDSFGTATTSGDKFFSLSYSEIVGSASDYWSKAPALNTEGAQYAYFASKAINGYAANSCLANIYKTRAGANPEGAYSGQHCWLRSPNISNTSCFLIIGDGGNLYSGSITNPAYSVAPAFCF